MQAAVMRTPSPDIRKALDPFLRIAPRELMAFAFFHQQPREMASFIEDTLDAENRKLIEDTLASGPFKNLKTLLDRWLGDLEPGFALLLNRQEFASTPTHPPYFGATFAVRMRNPGLWQRIHHDLLDHLKEDLTIQNARLEQPRVDVEMMFYTFRANPYGDVTTPAFARFGDIVVFSTAADFVRRMADIYLDGNRYGLARSREIDVLFEGAHRLDRHASAFFFLDVRRSLRWVDDMAPSWARAASLRQQLDNAAAKRKSLEYQANGRRDLNSPDRKRAWVDDQMRRWYAQLDDELKRRVDRTVGPMVKHLGVVHTAAATLGPAEGDASGIRLRATLTFDP